MSQLVVSASLAVLVVRVDGVREPPEEGLVCDPAGPRTLEERLETLAALFAQPAEARFAEVLEGLARPVPPVPVLVVFAGPGTLHPLTAGDAGDLAAG